MIEYKIHWVPSGLPDPARRSADPRWAAFDRAACELAISPEVGAANALPGLR
ncbi:MAG TPA: hypothetical protein VIZ43_00260 [Trebonia sp.]